tara:strand:- start:36033 stop:36788 length:756 start_codon:yes stop_codon:yes gene_type:complete
VKFFLISIVTIILLTSNVVKSEVTELPYCTSKSIWKHAAYKGVDDSFLQNIETAISSGYCGIELDIIYDEKEKIIYISHNPIDSTEYKRKKSLIHLEKIIKDKNIYIWLDWKNTKLSNLSKGMDIIKDSMKGYLSNENSLILIETPNLIHNEILNLLNKDKNIAILNWISYSSNEDSLIEKTKNIFRFTRAWVYICYFSDKWVSSHDIKILKLCQNERKVKSIFIFTINDLKKAKKAFLMGANVVLSDSLK